MRSNPKFPRFLLAAFAALALLPVGDGVARTGDRSDDPEYGATFGRVRYLEGALTLERSGEGEVGEATVNSPVVPGDRLTSEDGRAEVGLADGSTIWLDRGSRLRVRNLADADNEYEMTNLFALESGGVRIDAPEPEGRGKTFRVDTEAGSVYLLSGGSFRIDIEEGVTTLYSFRGVAELSGDDGSILVRTGERSSVQAGRAPSDPRRFNTARLDDFDRFVEGRQEAYLRRDNDQPTNEIVEEVPQEVEPYVSELSYYGSWHSVPDYGWVWRPVYYGAWGPYVNGYWTWCPTGWVWVSYDPWGWAPYHYGRWDFVVSLGWVWIPGRIWSGAWVSFAVGPSYVGWCPLNYYNRPVFQDVTIINVVNVNVTRLQPRGWRFVSVDAFADPRAARTSVRADRLPRGTDVVITSRLPRFNPREVAGRPERGVRFVETVRAARVPLPAAVDRDNRPVPFRNVETGRAAPRGRRETTQPGAGDRSRNPRLRPSTRPDAPATGPRSTSPRGQGTPRVRPGDGSQEGTLRAPQGGTARAPQGPQRERVAPPARDPGARRDAASPRDSTPPRSTAPPRGNTAPRERPRSEPNDRERRQPPKPDDGDRRNAPRDNARGVSPIPDEAVEKLFDGVRGDRDRPRPAPSRVAPPQPPRPEAAPPHPQPRPPAPKPPPPRKRHESDDEKGGRRR